MSETKVFKNFTNFLNGVGKTPKTEMTLADLKRAYPNEWAIFSEGELGEKAAGLCIYCGEVTKGSNVCVSCDSIMNNDVDYEEAYL